MAKINFMYQTRREGVKCVLGLEMPVGWLNELIGI